MTLKKLGVDLNNLQETGQSVTLEEFKQVPRASSPLAIEFYEHKTTHPNSYLVIFNQLVMPSAKKRQ